MTEQTEKYSPDKKYKLTFFNSFEPKMGKSMSEFSLIDLQTSEEITFAPLFAVGYNGYSTLWSKNSNYFALPICSPLDCFFVYDIANKQFASIHFSNVWVLAANLNMDQIDIEFKDSQIPEPNEHNKYPTKHFSKPANLTFKFSELKWTDIKTLKQFKELNKNSAIIDLEPIDNGWRQFKGQLPQTTEVLVWELNEFAKYGDNQSREWLEEIKSKTNDINFWVNATQYLGHKKRK